MIECPYCKKEITPEHYSTMFRNCECYGSNYYKSMCPKCSMPISVYLRRIVEFRSISKSNHNKDDCSF